jgi:hypothetical protein
MATGIKSIIINFIHESNQYIKIAQTNTVTLCSNLAAELKTFKPFFKGIYFSIMALLRLIISMILLVIIFSC